MVGYEEVHHLTETGRLFTIFIIICGIGTAGYAIGNITSFLIGGEARRIFMEGILEKKLAKLKDHVIVLGFGKFGRIAANEIARKGVPLVIIEKSEEKVQAAKGEGYQALQGDATDEHLMEKIGIMRAKGLVAALSEEADNVFAVLTARVLNPKLIIVSRGEEEESEKKLLRAGANRVILAYRIGGLRMAAVVLQPAIMDFLDVIFCGDELALELMQFPVPKKSPLTGKMLKETDIRTETGGALIVGIKGTDGKLITNPRGSAVIMEGDTIIALGSPEHLELLEKMVKR